MITIKRLCLEAKTPIIRFRTTFNFTSIVMRLVQMCVIILTLFPCVTFSQELKTDQEMAKDLQELVDKSEIIVDAQVISKEAKLAKEGNVYTSTKFKVFNMIKGVMESNEFTLNILGGTVDIPRPKNHPNLKNVPDSIKTIQMTQRYNPEIIEFNLQERAVLFLEKTSLQKYNEYIRRDMVSGEKVYIKNQAIDVNQYVSVLKKSVTDKSALSTLFDEVKKKAEMEKSVAPVFSPANPHPKVIAVPIPNENLKDTVKQEQPKVEAIDRNMQGGVK